MPPGAVVARWLSQTPYVGGLTCVECEFPGRTDYWITGVVDGGRFEAVLAGSGVKFDYGFGIGLRTELLRQAGVDPAPFVLPPGELCQHAEVQVAGGFYEVVADPKTHRASVFVSQRRAG